MPNLFKRPLSPPLSKLFDRPTQAKGGGGYSPAAFLAKYPAARWWSPRELAQSDSTAIAQVNDKSANANHLVQATGANQPTFTIAGGVGRAVFDANDGLTLAANAVLNIGSVTKMTMVAAIRHTKASGAAVIAETGAQLSVGGSVGVLINNGAGGSSGAGIGTGGGNYNFRDVSGVGTVPRNYVMRTTFDASLAAASEIDMWIDGIQQATVNVAAAGSVTGNIPSADSFTVGFRKGGSLYFESQLFDLVVIPGDCDAADLLALDQYLFASCGF